MKLKLIKMKCVQSTNSVALKLIKKNHLKPTLITSVMQTKGRGTMGKKWISQKDNLFISIFFEIDQRKVSFKQYALLNAHLFKKIMEKFILRKIDIKWPNDLLIKKEKICGILQEVIYFKNKSFLIIGAGINTNNSPVIKNYKTTSLSDIEKKKIDNNKILKEIKKDYEKFINQTKKYTFIKLKKEILKKNELPSW
ncbi:MAG: BirA family transcriptional regulator/ biotin-[acetyl-CoA-carboxylase] ligase [Pelagibacterales bacterium]|nr:BirA family transcriptional regulator/ biotin-[acetyl-CoA-carboxylase] ligase [Pelagibacterales bacterium]